MVRLVGSEMGGSGDPMLACLQVWVVMRTVCTMVKVVDRGRREGTEVLQERSHTRRCG